MSKNQLDAHDHYTANLIRHKARQLVGKYGFSESDRDDLEQELSIDLVERLPKYDPSKASKSTFINRLIERKISRMIRYRTQAMRDYRREQMSLNDRISDGKDGEAERVYTISSDVQARRTGQHRRTEGEQRELCIDVRSVLDRLSPSLIQTAKVLMFHRPAAAARVIGIPRSTLYEQHIAQLREVFEERSLQKYY